MDLLRRLAYAWRETGTHFPEFRRLLMCIACYQAGISVVITLSAVYASEVMGFTTPQIMLLVFTVNIAAGASRSVTCRIASATSARWPSRCAAGS